MYLCPHPPGGTRVRRMHLVFSSRGLRDQGACRGKRPQKGRDRASRESPAITDAVSLRWKPAAADQLVVRRLRTMDVAQLYNWAFRISFAAVTA